MNDFKTIINSTATSTGLDFSDDDFKNSNAIAEVFENLLISLFKSTSHLMNSDKATIEKFFLDNGISSSYKIIVCSDLVTDFKTIFLTEKLSVHFDFFYSSGRVGLTARDDESFPTLKYIGKEFIDSMAQTFSIVSPDISDDYVKFFTNYAESIENNSIVTLLPFSSTKFLRQLAVKKMKSSVFCNPSTQSAFVCVNNFDVISKDSFTSTAVICSLEMTLAKLFATLCATKDTGVYSFNHIIGEIQNGVYTNGLQKVIKKKAGVSAIYAYKLLDKYNYPFDKMFDKFYNSQASADLSFNVQTKSFLKSANSGTLLAKLATRVSPHDLKWIGQSNLGLFTTLAMESHFNRTALGHDPKTKEEVKGLIQWKPPTWKMMGAISLRAKGISFETLNTTATLADQLEVAIDYLDSPRKAGFNAHKSWFDYPVIGAEHVIAFYPVSLNFPVFDLAVDLEDTGNVLIDVDQYRASHCYTGPYGTKARRKLNASVLDFSTRTITTRGGDPDTGIGYMSVVFGTLANASGTEISIIKKGLRLYSGISGFFKKDEWSTPSFFLYSTRDKELIKATYNPTDAVKYYAVYGQEFEVPTLFAFTEGFGSVSNPELTAAFQERTIAALTSMSKMNTSKILEANSESGIETPIALMTEKEKIFSFPFVFE